MVNGVGFGLELDVCLVLGLCSGLRLRRMVNGLGLGLGLWVGLSLGLWCEPRLRVMVWA